MRYTIRLFTLAATLISLGGATRVPTCVPTATTSVVLPAGTVIGSVGEDGVEYFRGIPFAEPPTGSRRLKPPVRLRSFVSGSVQATGVGPACPQMSAIDFTPLLLDVIVLPGVEQTLTFGSALGDETEDCLTISVMRPQGTRRNAKLPVLFWIYGGGFQTGSPQMYNGSVLIPESVSQGKPIILVAVNYRLGAFGFLGGKEVLTDGAANLGLLDQRMGLEWVADNIAAFGGDPNAVTIWGQSAGAMSVFDQLALFDGDNTYKNRRLFRGAIMNSGSITPTEPVDGVKAQEIFDTVVERAGCASATGSAKLECLRGLDYNTFVDAANSVPTYLGYNSLAFSYAPRPDGRILTASPEELVQKGKYAAVPIIIGNQQNEGTVFALFQSDLATESVLVSYLNDVFFHNSTREDIEGLVATYADIPDRPVDAGASDNIYTEFNRLAVILGDWEFNFMARLLLENLPAKIPAWSYLATYADETPILGTYHSTDLPHIYYETSNVSTSIQALWISFVNSLDPNNYAPTTPTGYLTSWPTWQKKKQSLEFGARSTRLVDYNVRAASYEYIRTRLATFRL